MPLAKVGGLHDTGQRLQDSTSRAVRRIEQGLKIQNVDVDPTKPTNGQVLTYSSTAGKWAPATPSSGNSITLPESMPRLIYATAGTVTLVPPPGYTNIRVTLNDGVQRSTSSNITWNISTDLDTGSEAASTWYYIYLIPDPSDDTSLEVIGTLSADNPSASYPTYRYVGAVRNNSSSDIWPFDHASHDLFMWREYHVPTDGSVGTLGTGAKTNAAIDLLSYTTKYSTAVLMHMWIKRDNTSTAGSVGQRIHRRLSTLVSYEHEQHAAADAAVAEGSFWHFLHDANLSWTRIVEYSSFVTGGAGIDEQEIQVRGYVDGPLSWG